VLFEQSANSSSSSSSLTELTDHELISPRIAQ